MILSFKIRIIGVNVNSIAPESRRKVSDEEPSAKFTWALIFHS